MNLVNKGNNIPIIGQPQVREYLLTLLVKCPCGQQFQLVGQIGSMRVCPGVSDKSCNKMYRMDAVPVVGANGQGGAPVLINADGGFSCGLSVGFIDADAPPAV